MALVPRCAVEHQRCADTTANGVAGDDRAHHTKRNEPHEKVAKVTRMDYMFRFAHAFNGDVSGWCARSLLHADTEHTHTLSTYTHIHS